MWSPFLKDLISSLPDAQCLQTCIIYLVTFLVVSDKLIPVIPSQKQRFSWSIEKYVNSQINGIFQTSLCY